MAVKVALRLNPFSSNSTSMGTQSGLDSIWDEVRTQLHYDKLSFAQLAVPAVLRALCPTRNERASI